MAYETSAEKKILFGIIAELKARQLNMTGSEKWADSQALVAVTGDLSAAVRNYRTRMPGTGRGACRS